VAAITANSLRPYFFRSASAQADTGQTDWLLTPPWANYVWIMLNVTATAGTTPTVTPAFLSADPVSMDDANVVRVAEHANFTANNGTAAQYIYQIGPGVTGIADDVTQSATVDSYVSLNAILPAVLGVTLTLDRTTGNETYTYALAVYFRS